MSAKDKRQKKVTEYAAPSGKGKERAPALGMSGTTSQPASPVSAEAVPTSQESDLQKILHEMQGLRAEVTQQMGAHGIKLDLMKTRIDAMAERFTEAEGRILALEDTVAPIEKSVQELTCTMKMLQAAVEDAEGRSRRANVRIVGMPEATLKGSMEEFLEANIPLMLPNVKLSNYFVIERAHRVPGTRPKPGAPPRPIVAKLLNYRDRDALLRAARDLGDVQWQGTRISFYQDLTPAVLKARKHYDTIKVELRKRAIPYAILHPAKLRIQINGAAHFFQTPKAAWDFIDTLAMPGRESPRSSNN